MITFPSLSQIFTIYHICVITFPTPTPKLDFWQYKAYGFVGNLTNIKDITASFVFCTVFVICSEMRMFFFFYAKAVLSYLLIWTNLWKYVSKKYDKTASVLFVLTCEKLYSCIVGTGILDFHDPKVPSLLKKKQGHLCATPFVVKLFVNVWKIEVDDWYLHEADFRSHAGRYVFIRVRI